MKKTPKIISLILAITFSFSLIACAGEETNAEMKKRLTDTVRSSDLRSGIVTFNMESEKIGYDAKMLVANEEGDYKFDMYLMGYEVDKNISRQKKQATALYLRDNNVYTIIVDDNKDLTFFPVASSNYELEINNHILTTTDKIGYLCTRDEFYARAVDLFITFFPDADAFVEKMPTFADILISVAQNEYALSSAGATKVYNGYRLNVDVVKLLQDLVVKFVSIGRSVDNDTTKTVEDVYRSEEFSEVFESVFKKTEAKTVGQFISCINDLLKKRSYDFQFEVPEFSENENAYDYLGRFLNTKVKGITVGSLRITDITEKFGMQSGDSVEKLFKKTAEKFYEAFKKFTDALNVIYFFDDSATLQKIAIDFNLKHGNFIVDTMSVYDNAHVKVNFVPCRTENLFASVA